MYDLADACAEAGLKHQARGLFNKISASDSNFKDIKNRINTINQPSGSGREIPEAVMVADICESSRMMDLYGDSATYIIKNALEGIMFPIFKDKKSSFTKSTGDGFLVCFPNSKCALDAAIQVLESVNTYNSNVADGPQIHLRFGIHFGEVRVRPDGDRHGTNINIPFRVEGLKGDDLVIVKDGISREEFTLIDRIFITEALYNDVLKKGNYNIRYLGVV
jgi:class 3 adenylate cyclase